MKSTLSTAGLVGAMAIVALTGVACGGSSSSGSSSSASSSETSSVASGAESPSESAPPINYAPLLITPYDIDMPDETFTAGQPQMNPGGTQGVAVAFTNEEQTRTIDDSIAVFPDADAAKAGLDGGVAALDQSIANPSPQPAEVGTNGVVASGTSPDGSKAVTVVAFTQGPAFVLMRFDSAAGDPVPEDFAISLAQKQAGVVESALG
ncbi:MAG: hypothetical protein ACRDUX_08060 [Mycobacterium sp.]